MNQQDASNALPSADRRGVGAGLSLAVVAGLVACLLAATYLARTPLVLGSTVGPHLERLAARHQINLTVGTFAPQGLHSLRLEGVQVVAHRDGYLIEADLETVSVTPSLRALLEERRFRPESVEVRGGRIHISRAGEAVAAPKSEDAGDEDAGDEPAPSVDGPDASSATKTSPPRPWTSRAVLHDISVSVDPSPLPMAARPLRLHRAEFDVRAPPAAIELRSGYGLLPDGTSFAMRPRPSTDPIVYAIEPRSPPRLDRWFDGPRPAAVSVEAIAVCPRCAPARLDLEGLRLFDSTLFSAHGERLSVLVSDDEVRTSLPQLDLTDGEQSPHQLTNLETIYDVQADTVSVQGNLVDDQQGRATFAAYWMGQWGVLDTHIHTQRFDSGALWKRLGVSERIAGGVWTGKIEAAYEPALDLAEVSVDLGVSDVTVEVPVVSDDELAFERAGLTLEALLQPRAATVSVSNGQAHLGEAGPIAFGGYVTGAAGAESNAKSWVFDAHAAADGLDPQQLRDGLPPSLSRLAHGTDFDGEFGFRIQSAGHTAYPESLSLEVVFSGDVDARDRDSLADVLALASDGPPSIELPGALAENLASDAWVTYEGLPAHVPRVLTAAEDAHFFSHDGFDWRGLRRAMVHNIEEGGIVRGGSTLSQQLSKNLFLDHRRTLARKLQEAYVTWRIESELSKRRILELYMNMVDFGPNIQGLRQAARRYFEVEPEELTIAQTALLAAVLPGPSLYGGRVLAGYLPSSRLEKIEHILSNLRFLRVITPDDYRRILAAASTGDVAPLELTVCDDDGQAPEGAPRCP
jgi:penicillin-binding protein 1A